MEISENDIKNLSEYGFDKNAVYVFLNEQTKDIYIGSTNNLKRRLRDHKRELNNGTHYNKKFQDSFNENPDFKIAAIPVVDRTDAFIIENFLISQLSDDQKLLNISKDVNSLRLNADVSDETKEKQSISMKAFYANGGKNPMEGKKHSEKTKEFLREKAIEQFSNPKAIETARRKALERFSNKDSLDKFKDSLRKGWDNPEAKKHASDSAKERWKDEKQREHLVSKAIARASTEEGKISSSKGGQKTWENPEFREKHCKKVSVDGVIFSSLSEASRYFNVSIATINNRINSETDKFSGWKNA